MPRSEVVGRWLRRSPANGFQTSPIRSEVLASNRADSTNFGNDVHSGKLIKVEGAGAVSKAA
jgi:hypothetical protein